MKCNTLTFEAFPIRIVSANNTRKEVKVSALKPDHWNGIQTFRTEAARQGV